MRTHYCADLGLDDINKEVSLCGWCHGYRDHGGVVFIDLRDRSGLIQLVFDPREDAKSHMIASGVRDEFVLFAKGKIRKRADGLENPKLKTGAIEVLVSELVIENTSQTPPIGIGDEGVGEDVRLKYRYLDLRNPRLQEIFALRSAVMQQVRQTLCKLGFLEIETPILTKATPEGARDYLVPSRIYEGEFFALPQSPQLFKQLLMVSGFDRYFQIARCFRDEDLRLDRQPEFTQIDLEMSFCSQDDVMEVAEKLLAAIFRAAGHEIATPFARYSYAEVMEKYGSDKPDLRYGMPLVEVGDLFCQSSNEIFKKIANNPKDNRFKALCVRDGDAFFSRKILSQTEEFVRKFGAKGLAYLQIKADGPKGPLVKFLSEVSLKALLERVGAQEGDIIFFGAGEKRVVWDYMGRLRQKIAMEMGLVNPKQHAFLWVVDFPMFERDSEGNISALHHPFTMPKNIDASLEEISSMAYDVVLNGFEIGGGSLRIHKQEIQQKVFGYLGIGEDEAKEKFGFLLDALQYGAPPHGGLAFGLDRIIMLLTQAQSIRDVIAFPKTQKSACLLTQAPSAASQEQLRELHIRIKETTKEKK